MRYREPLRARRLEMGRAPIFCVHIAQTLHKIHIDMSQQPNILCELCSKYNTIAECCKTNANHHSLHRNAAMFVQNMTVMYVTKFCAPEHCSETTISSSNPRESNPSSNLQMFNLLVSLDPRTLEDVRSPLSPGSINYY